MKFDNIIQNPPYGSTTHIKFFELSMGIVSKNGMIVIIEPATWLIGGNKPDFITNAKGHIKSIIVENLNEEFNTKLRIPFSITCIDFANHHDMIDYKCCGYHMSTDNIDNCNLLWDMEIVNGIMEKVSRFPDVMEKHITDRPLDKEGVYYARYSSMATHLCEAKQNCRNYDSDKFFISTANGLFHFSYISVAFHYNQNEISEQFPRMFGPDRKLSDKPTKFALYGTKEELENWKHFIYNNKLPMFINAAFTYSNVNMSLKKMPWITDNVYSDEEINKMFGFTDREIMFMDFTLKKFEKSSCWNKRYLFGNEYHVTDEDVQSFIESILC